LIRIDGASYLNGYCSLMFFCMFFAVSYKSEKKHVFMFFICKLMFLTSMLSACKPCQGLRVTTLWHFVTNILTNGSFINVLEIRCLALCQKDAIYDHKIFTFTFRKQTILREWRERRFYSDVKKHK